MTLRSAGLAVAVGSPLFALYILGVILLLDLDSPLGQYALSVPVALFLGFMPWGFLLHQMTSSGARVRNTRISRLSVFVAALDTGKGGLAVGLGWAATGMPEGTMITGLAVLTGDVASRLLFRYGGSGPVSVGALLAMAWLPGVLAVASVPIAILAVIRGLPGGLLVALAVILGPLVLALVGETKYIYLVFAVPASVLMLFQYRSIAPQGPVNEATRPTLPGNT